VSAGTVVGRVLIWPFDELLEPCGVQVPLQEIVWFQQAAAVVSVLPCLYLVFRTSRNPMDLTIVYFRLESGAYSLPR
jgi:hypothetical protein